MITLEEINILFDEIESEINSLSGKFSKIEELTVENIKLKDIIQQRNQMNSSLTEENERLKANQYSWQKRVNNLLEKMKTK
jgi:FtsZ-binding cell division protein ZapB